MLALNRVRVHRGWPVLAAFTALALTLAAQGEVVGYGWVAFRSALNHDTYLDVACGNIFTVGLRSDGTLAAFGVNNLGQCNVPQAPAGTRFVAISASGGHVLVLRSDGQVQAFGENASGQCNVPPPPAGMTYVAVAAGGSVPYGHSLALRSDGQIVGWGANSYGQRNAPVPPSSAHPPGDSRCAAGYR